jgi:hypothetical protein
MSKTYNFPRLDANENIFFARELTYVKKKTYDIKYPTLRVANGEMIPISREASPGDDTIVYQQFDQHGIAKIIASYANDLPRSDISGKEFVANIRSIGNSFGYTKQEIRAAQTANKPLTTRKSSAARRAQMEEQQRVAIYGDVENGLSGWFSNPNIPSVAIPADGTGGLTTFASKTADQMIRDLNSVANSIAEITNGVEIPDTLLLPVAQFNLISTTVRPQTDKTVLRTFLDNQPYIKNVSWLNELKGAGAGGTDRMVAYRRDPEAFTLEIPMDITMEAPEQNGLEFTVAIESRIGGVLVYYPLSQAFGDGI